MRKLLLTLALVAAPALAVDYPQEDLELCDQQGGCAIVSRAWLAERLQQARDEGRKEGRAEGEATATALAARPSGPKFSSTDRPETGRLRAAFCFGVVDLPQLP